MRSVHRGGREVKHTGDGIMASFVSTVAAVRCAIRIQRALAAHEQANKEVPVKVRIGAAAGEPVENHLDLFGSTVQLAARLCSHAEPEQSLVSNAVAELCLGKGLTFQDLGEVLLKGSLALSEYMLSNSAAARGSRRSVAKLTVDLPSSPPLGMR